MKISVVWPTIRPQVAIETVHHWKKMGYLPLLMMNKEADHRKFKDTAGVIVKDTYEGYFRECNLLAGICFENGAEVVVFAGDYIFPDPNIHASEVKGEKYIHSVGQPCYERHEPCWSPWVGRAFWNSTYHRKGPFHYEYFQFHGGRELEAVAKKIGNFWETDVIHQHMRVRPELDKDFHRKHNINEYQEKDYVKFKEREKENFPGAWRDDKLILPPNAGRIILPGEF